jgi:glycosyltransferase involved in cell wall biosynthesis
VPPRLTLGFDAKRAFRNRTGLGNYSRDVLRALRRRFPDHRYLLYTPDARPVVPLDTAAMAIGAPPALARAGPAAAVWRAFVLGRRAARDGVQVFHGLSQELPRDLPRSGPAPVVTMHDLLALRFPEFYPAIDRRVYLWKARWSCRRAVRVIASSEQTRRDLVERLQVPADKIRVVYPGADPRFAVRLAPDEVRRTRERYGLPEDYALSVGTIEPRKNALLLLRALARLPAEQRPFLALVGRPTRYLERLDGFARDAGLAGEWRVLPRVPPEDLPALYQGAALFLYPSHFEGFGIPILEALRSGVPVITSTGSCFDEVGGRAARYVDPDDPEALADVIRRVLQDGAEARQMVEEGFRQARRFEDDALAEGLMAVYTEALACDT